jgi:2-polyprenyl-3-methyl-5-hydroxy-6-metoxy-1,4-benzoquinol methylase
MEKRIEPNDRHIVLFAETIEHLYTSPKLVLSFIKTFLRRGGFLIIQTPNAVSISKRIAMLNGSNPFEMIRESRDIPGHFREYTGSELYGLGKEIGLVCDKIIYTNYWPQSEIYAELENKYPTLRSGITIIFQKQS